MTKTTSPTQNRTRAVRLGIALTLASVGLPLAAQSAKPSSTTAKPGATDTEEVLRLSPFSVSDTEESGYRARNTLAGTRLKTDLKDVAASISVLTKEFLGNTSATNLESFLVYTTNTEATGIGGNFTGANTSEDANIARMERTDARPQFGTRVRGLSAADLSRDYFITDVPLDSYNVDRVDINRGPNSALFGLGSPGGVINSGLKHAGMKNRIQAENKVDQYGSLRNVLDFNQVIFKDTVALRVVGLKEDRKFKQEVAMNKDKRLFADLVIRPFKQTKINVNAEWGTVNSRLPKTLPPVDRISPWFQFGKPGFTAATFANPANDPALTALNLLNPNVVQGFADGTNFSIIYNQPNNSSSSVNGSIDGLVSQWNKNFDTDTNLAALNNLRLLAIGTTADVIRGNPAAVGLNAAQANFYNARRIMDPSVFNFYEQNVEGPNYGGFKNFRVVNASVEQNFFNQKLGVELAFSQQFYDDGFTTHSSQTNTDALSIDINKTLYDGSVNPNYGRPYTGGNGYAESYGRTRDVFRATAFGEFDFKDHATDGFLSQLGRHVLTSLFSNNKREARTRTYMNLRATSDLNVRKGATTAVALASQNGGLRGSWITYLAPPLTNATSLAGANIPGITATQNPQATTNALLWNQVTNKFDSGQTQSLYNYNVPTQRDDLWAFNGSGTKESIDSLAFVLQSFFLQRKLVSTVSWRTDSVTQFAGPSPNNPVTGLVQLPGHPVYGATPIVDARSSNWSYGLVGHAPDFINRRLPWGLAVSAHFNDSQNFNAAAAGRNLYAAALPFPAGTTREWGVSIANEKFSARFTAFKTDQTAATVNFPGQGTLWTEIQNLYTFNTPAEIAASGFKVPQEIVAAVLFRPTGNTGPLGNPEYTSINPVQGNIKETQDYTSKGFEFELTYSPTKNWRIATNVAKTESITANTAPYLAAFIERVMVPLWNDPKIGGALYTADRGVNNNPLNLYGARSISLLNQVRSAQLRDGSVVTDGRKYRVNLLNNYDFDRSSKLAGFSVGGAVRYQSKVAIGNPLILLASGPFKGTYASDLANPYYGKAESNFDGWIGYQRKIERAKIDWGIKFRVKNIGVGNKLIPSRANPDGTVYDARIAESQTWELVNTFKF